MTSPGGGRTLADAWIRLRGDGSALGPDVRRETIKTAGSIGDEAGRTFGDRMRSALKAAAVGGAIIGTAVVVEMRKAVAAASDLGETQSKIGVLFGESADKIRAFAATAATSMGQSRQTALDGAAAFAVYGRAAGKSGDDLVQFSSRLVTLASDVASFSNADPAAVIADFGSAMRGEFDPIEKYGVLLNESNVKQRALALGIIKTTKEALTPQQRVLAVQAEIFAQTGAAQGDFARTSAGLANQQRILNAQMDNLRATVGEALLPVITRFVTFLNTTVIPAVQRFAVDHGPEMAAVFGDIRAAVSSLVRDAGAVDWARLFEQGRAAVAGLVPAVKELKREAPQINDSLRVAGVVMGFLADHSDELANALPYLAAGLIAVKVATIAANVANAISPILILAQIVASRRLAASNLELAAATAAQTAATTASAAATTGATVAENAGILAKGRAVVVSAAHRVATIASATATGIATGAQWLLNAALTANPIGIVIVAIGALVAALVYAYRNSETFRNIVNRVWSDVRTTIMGVVNWFTQTAWPALQAAYAAISRATDAAHRAVVAAWRGIQDGVGGVYRWIRDNVFNPLISFVADTIPARFRRGVDLVSEAWSRLRGVAAAPVRFMIETVVNDGIVGVFNRVAGFLGVKTRLDRVPMPAGLHAGGSVPYNGMLPGPPSDVDNLLAVGPGGQPIGLAGGEMVVNARQTARWRPVLEAINSGVAGFAEGGIVDFFKNPAAFVRGQVSSGLSTIRGRFGDTGVAPLVTGAASGILDMVVDKVQDMFGDAGTIGTARSITGSGMRSGAIMAILRQAFPDLGLISGYRPGSRTLSGSLSYHAMDRAVDVAPIRAVATYARAVFGAKIRELITPFQELNMLNGRPHVYTGDVWNQHNFAGGNAHIHLALRRGGFVKSFDKGGAWNSGVIGLNTSGRTEQVASGETMDSLVDRLDRVIELFEDMPDNLARALTGGMFAARQLGRAR